MPRHRAQVDLAGPERARVVDGVDRGEARGGVRHLVLQRGEAALVGQLRAARLGGGGQHRHHGIRWRLVRGAGLRVSQALVGVGVTSQEPLELLVVLDDEIEDGAPRRRLRAGGEALRVLEGEQVVRRRRA